MKEFKVKGMKCEHCKARVENAIKAVAGVDSVSVDLASGKATVSGDFSNDAVRNAVAAAGYACE